jgi:hypothetical protein
MSVNIYSKPVSKDVEYFCMLPGALLMTPTMSPGFTEQQEKNLPTTSAGDGVRRVTTFSAVAEFP